MELFRHIFKKDRSKVKLMASDGLVFW